jgi:L-ascorbate metabolism protein UlaG (beta-lactamase superfamily)
MARAVTQVGSPIAPAPERRSSPILDDPGLAVLWVGHATVLIQMHDKVFITDPMFTRTVGMVMRRKVEPGLDPAVLKGIDFTLISHIHFDHFSYGSLDQLPQNGVLLLPLGSLPYTPAFSYRGIRELSLWEVFEEDGVRITAVPVQHFSGRYGFDIPWMRDRGYTGYVIEYRGTTVFFGGDTGYHPELFREIGRRFAVDVAILPIGPIEPRDFMQRYHIDPAEALQILEDVGARLLVPMHHRTFVQGFDPALTYAVDQLQELAAARGLSDRLVVLDIGEQRVLH